MKKSIFVLLLCFGVLAAVGCGEQPAANDGEVEIDQDSGATRIVVVDDLVV